MWKSCNRRVKIAELSLNLRQRDFSCGLVDRVGFVIPDRLLSLLESFLLLPKPCISQSKSRRTVVRIRRHDCVGGGLDRCDGAIETLLRLGLSAGPLLA